MSKSNDISTAAPTAATIITGGGRGIGRAIALRMAHETALLVVGRTEAEETVKNTNPQKRIIPAEEVAEAVALVASGKLPSLNGHPLMLTGGA